MITLASRWGPVQLAASGAGVGGVALGADPLAFARSTARRLGRVVVERAGSGADAGHSPPLAACEQLDRARAELERELAGEASGVTDLPLDPTGLSAFDLRVLEAVRDVRRGETLSYGGLARRIGAPRAARAVGGAVGRDPFWLVVPCHRIVAARGRLGGYGRLPYGTELKRELLAREGVAVPLAIEPAWGARTSAPAADRPTA